MAVLSKEAGQLKRFMCGTVCGHLIDRIVRLAPGCSPPRPFPHSLPGIPPAAPCTWIASWHPTHLQN